MPESNTTEQVKDYSLELYNALDQTLLTPLRNIQFFYADTFSSMYAGNIFGFVMTMVTGGVMIASYIAARVVKDKREAGSLVSSYAAVNALARKAETDDKPMTKEEYEEALEKFCGMLNDGLEASQKNKYAFVVENEKIEFQRKVKKIDTSDEDVLPGFLGELQLFFRKTKVQKAVTTATLYMMGYWVLWMIMQIAVAFTAVASGILMPLYLQFVLPAIIPMGYWIFTDKKPGPKKDEEMEAARLLAVQAFMMRVQAEAFEEELTKARSQRVGTASEEKRNGVAHVAAHNPMPEKSSGSISEFRTRLLNTRPKSKALFGFVGGFMFMSFVLWPLMDFLGSYGGLVFFAGAGGVAVPFFIAIVVGIVMGVVAYKMAVKKRNENAERLKNAGIMDESLAALDAQAARVEELKKDIATLRGQLGTHANNATYNPQVHFPEYNDHTFFTFGHLKTTQKEHVWSKVKKFLQRFRIFLNDTGSVMYLTRATYLVLAFCGAFAVMPTPAFVVFVVALTLGVIYGVIGAYQKYHKNQQEKCDDALLQRFPVVKQTLEVHERLLTQQKKYLEESVSIVSSLKSSEKGKGSVQMNGVDHNHGASNSSSNISGLFSAVGALSLRLC